MKLKYTLSLIGLGLSSFTYAQSSNDWISDTVRMEEGYQKSVYYSMEDGSVKKENMDKWQIAIRADLMSVGIYANHAGAGIDVYELFDSGAPDKFGDNLVADTVGIKDATNRLYNDIQHWDTGAFNQNNDPTDQFDFGWGDYQPTSHAIAGEKIYLVTSPTKAFQVWIEKVETFGISNPPEWTIHIAEIDGSNAVTYTFEMKPTYENRLFAYYNLEQDEFHNLDPLNEDWDFMFTRYSDEVAPGMMYPVTGVLSNQDRPVKRLKGEDALDAEWDASFENEMSTEIAIIGRDWKSSNMDNGVYEMDTLSYFIKVANEDIWQFEFTFASLGNTADFPNVEPGAIGIRKRKVQEGVSINNVNNDFNSITVAPNPAQSSTMILVDAKENMNNASLMISDISGRILQTQIITIQKGSQQIPLNISQLTSGMYFINIVTNGMMTTEKLIVK